MKTNFNSPVTDEEVVAACKAGCFFVTSESVKDVRNILEGFVAGRTEQKVECNLHNS